MARAKEHDAKDPPVADTETRTAAPIAAPRDASAPALLLAFARGAFAGTDVQPIPTGGVVLGRRAALFGAEALDDPQMSRRHAEIVLSARAPQSLQIRDLGSRNWTYVNGEPVQGATPLAPGDVVRLGSTIFLATTTAEAAPAHEDPDLVGRSAAIEAVRSAVAAVARRDNTVLVTGETGAGKELVARAVHRQSGRSGELVAVNCGGLAEGVLESELFGHVRGAFSGAGGGRDGLFRAAEKGTLFLDELCEMPPALQVKLLRAIETRKVRPVGSEHEVAVDVRIVAATNRNVVTDVLKGRFRSDLYARLSQWTIHVPPLRERREDVPLLAQRLLARAGGASRPMDSALAEAILLHAFPLNVRGLLNLLSVAVIAARPGDTLQLGPKVQEALANERRLASTAAGSPPRELAGEPAAPRESEPPAPAERGAGIGLGAEEIEAALRRAEGNVAEAARRLGCSRQHLYRCIGALGIDPARFRAPGAAPT